MLPPLPQDFVERLAGQISQFEEGFETLSKASTLKDMARVFAGLLRSNLQTAEPGIFHLSIEQKRWERFYGEDGQPFPETVTLPATNNFSLQHLDNTHTRIGVVQPLTDGSTLGVVLARKTPGGPFTEIDKLSLQLLLQLYANAHRPLLQRRNEKELVFSLNHRVLQLNSLIDTGIEVSKLKREGSLHQLALERAASLTNASRGLLVVSSKGQEIERYAFPGGKISVDHINTVHRIQSSFEFFNNTYTFELFEKESRAGTVPFDETDHILLNALARQVHASLENRYLLRQALEKQKIDQDIAVAASIQQRILPESLPNIEGYDLFGINIPSKSVGGDYYDCIPLSDGRIALVIADVSGKGVPAALLVSSFHAYLGAYLEGAVSLVQLTQRLNDAIYRASTDDRFITAFLALLDPKTGKLESVSAGHNPVYLVKSNGKVQELSAGGVALGMLDMEFPYQTDEVVIERGERLLLYTDGVTEAINEQEELYDNIVPVKEFIIKKRQQSAQEFIDALISDIKRFSGAAPQVDDITALYLIRC